MKKLLLTVFMGMQSFLLIAQSGNEDITGKMIIYIAKELSLNEKEEDAFTPLFKSYQKEWRGILKENRDRLERKQKIATLQLDYRNKFEPIMGKDKANRVFILQDRFLQSLRKINNSENRHKSYNSRKR